MKKRMCDAKVVGLVFVMLGISLAQDHTSHDLKQVDILERVYTDQAPEENSAPFYAACGGNAFFQFALSSASLSNAAALSFTLDSFISEEGILLDGSAAAHLLTAVPVEANSAGCMKSGPGIIPAPEVLEALVREAPFNIYEVVSDETSLVPDGRSFYAVLVRVQVGRGAVPGRYRGVLRLSSNGEVLAETSAELSVSSVLLPEQWSLESTHWLWPEPENLTTGKLPKWWSDEHWALLEAAGKTLHEYGDTSILTPLIFGDHPLVPVGRGSNGKLIFEFSNFDRWVDLFSQIGFTHFQGAHLGDGKWPKPATVSGRRAVYIVDPENGSQQPIGTDKKEWIEVVLPDFLDALYAHLKEKGWVERYRQSLCDEATEERLPVYTEWAALIHQHMPGVEIIDALNRDFPGFGEVMEIPVVYYGYTYVKKWKDYPAERVRNGGQHWIYSMCSPNAPHPNRHLDHPLACSRAFPWLADYCKASGYLNWAANIYRGADPYRSSIGPIPNGSQNPGHPPGDNWFFYKADGKMFSSMRMVAFLMGKEDYELLAFARRKNPVEAEAIAQSLVEEVVLDYSENEVRSHYQRTPQPYHDARLRLLRLLETQEDCGSK